MESPGKNYGAYVSHTCFDFVDRLGQGSAELDLGPFYSEENIVDQDNIGILENPAMNEHLGVVDLVINRPLHADDRYGGGHLFKDLVKGKEIDILVEAYGRTYENRATLEDIDFARIITIRLAFKNYHALINPTATTISTRFSVTGLTGPFT